MTGCIVRKLAGALPVLCISKLAEGPLCPFIQGIDEQDSLAFPRQVDPIPH